MNKDTDFDTKNIPEKLQKRLHLIYFTVKCILIGLIFFNAFQGVASLMLKDDIISGTEGTGFVSHLYCGTFFIELNMENSFVSEEAAINWLQRPDISSLGDIIINSFPIIIIICILLCILLALRNGDKNALFSRKFLKTSRLFITAGLAWMIGNIFSNIVKFIDIKSQDTSSFIGILSNQKYYCQIYNVLIIPFIILCCGLLLRQHERALQNKSTKRNEAILKALAIISLITALGFIFYRFGVRLYELITILSGKEISVRLPFYNLSLELPFSLAKSSESYTKLVVFRFIKDMPVFIASTVTSFLFFKLLVDSAKGKINTSVNKKRISVSIIVLIVSSLLFNIFGLFEVEMLNSNFTGIYGAVTYTIGLRSFCEPILYAMLLWFFGVYMQCVPENNALI